MANSGFCQPDFLADPSICQLALNRKLAPGTTKTKRNIPEIIPVPETNNRVWPSEVNYLFDQVTESSNLDAHLQNKLRHHINRLKMDGMPVDQIIDTAGTLARKMGATA